MTERLAANPTPAFTPTSPSPSFSPTSSSPSGSKSGTKSKRGKANGEKANGVNGKEVDEAREVQRPLSPGRNEGGYSFGMSNGDNDNGWLEVGKKNKTSVTRTVSPIL